MTGLDSRALLEFAALRRGLAEEAESSLQSSVRRAASVACRRNFLGKRARSDVWRRVALGAIQRAKASPRKLADGVELAANCRSEVPGSDR